MKKSLTGREVLKRMISGDRPTLRGGYSDASCFGDGAIVSHSVMFALFKKGKIERPEGTSIYSEWILTKAN